MKIMRHFKGHNTVKVLVSKQLPIDIITLDKIWDIDVHNMTVSHTRNKERTRKNVAFMCAQEPIYT